MVRSPRKQPRTPDLHRDLGVSWQSVGPEQMPTVAVGAGDSAETPCHCDRVTASGAVEQLCQETTQSPRSQSPQVSAQTRSPRGGGGPLHNNVHQDKHAHAVPQGRHGNARSLFSVSECWWCLHGRRGGCRVSKPLQDQPRQLTKAALMWSA